MANGAQFIRDGWWVSERVFRAVHHFERGCVVCGICPGFVGEHRLPDMESDKNYRALPTPESV